MSWNRDHLHGSETYEAKRARLRSNAEDPRPGIDFDDDPRDRYAPVPWWAIDPSFKTAPLPNPSLVGSRRHPAAPISPHRGGAAASNSAASERAGEPCSLAARPSTDRKAA